MSTDQVLDAMAAVHFHLYLQVGQRLRALPDDVVANISYNTLPDSERKMRRELMHSVLTVAVKAIDDEVFVEATDAGDIGVHQAAALNQRLDEWLDN